MCELTKCELLGWLNVISYIWVGNFCGHHIRSCICKLNVLEDAPLIWAAHMQSDEKRGSELMVVCPMCVLCLLGYK